MTLGSPEDFRRSAARADPAQCTMHNQISTTANRAREMQVIGFSQSVMAKWLRKIARTFQAFEQTDLERLLLRFSANRSKQSLHLSPMRQVADFVTKAEHELAVFR